MTWRDRIRESAENRLDHLITPSPPPTTAPIASTTVERDPSEPAEGSARHLLVGPWTPAAVRGLVILLVLIALVAGYLVWRSQPREVVAAPDIVQSADGVTGLPPESLPLDPAAGAGVASPGALAPEPSPSSEPVGVVVHVVGQVGRPGVVRLPPGSRVADAVEAAGGVTRRRAADSVNMARLVVDGEQIVVGASEGETGTTAAAAPGASAAEVGAGAATSGPLDINSASGEQLDALPGVGPVIAGRIVEWRTAHGRFSSVDELGEVSGIGEATLARLRPLVRV